VSATRLHEAAAGPPRGTTPAHLGTEQAAVWSALRLAVHGAGGRPVSLHEVLGPLGAIAPTTAGQVLRVELQLEALALDPRSGVRVGHELGGGAPRYAV
jgi:hypothetical protein